MMEELEESEPEMTDFELVGENSKTGFLLDDFNFLPEESHLSETLVNEASYVGRRLSTNIHVPANIHKPQYREFWCETLKPSRYVLDIIKFGYKLPFSSAVRWIPPARFSARTGLFSRWTRTTGRPGFSSSCRPSSSGAAR